MLLLELFDENENGKKTSDKLTKLMMDILTPFVAEGVPFVTVQQMIQKVSEARTGLTVDRGMIMDLLNPDEVKYVNKIEGDRIYLSAHSDTESSKSQDAAAKDQEHVSNMANDQASKALSGEDSPL